MSVDGSIKHDDKSSIDKVLDWWFKPFHVQYIRIYEVLMCLTMVYYWWI